MKGLWDKNERKMRKQLWWKVPIIPKLWKIKKRKMRKQLWWKVPIIHEGRKMRERWEKGGEQKEEIERKERGRLTHTKCQNPVIQITIRCDTNHN